MLIKRHVGINFTSLAATSKTSKSYRVVNELKTGSLFGEISAISKYLRVTTTIKATSRLACGTIEADKLGVFKQIVRVSITFSCKMAFTSTKTEYSSFGTNWLPISLL